MPRTTVYIISELGICWLSPLSCIQVSASECSEGCRSQPTRHEELGLGWGLANVPKGHS